LLISLLTIVSCKKEDDFGLNFIPEGERLSVDICDTFSIKAFTIDTGRYKSWKQTLSLLGEYNDPIFGKTKAGFVTQVRLSDDLVDFEPNSKAVGLTLMMGFNSFYGDNLNENSKMTINVYEVNNKIDSAFFGNEIDVSNYTTLLCSKEINPADLSTSNPMLIEFPLDVAQRFLDFDKAFMTLDLFPELFKGIYVTVSESNVNNSIIYLDLLSNATSLNLHYLDSKDSLNSYKFNINSSCSRTNIFRHEYDGTIVKNAVDAGENSTSNAYIQAMNGTRTVIRTPHFDKWFNSGEIAITKAQLIVKVDESTIDEINEPCSLINIFKLDTVTRNGVLDSVYHLIPDIVESGESYFDGNYDEDSKSYTFNMTKYFQDIVNKKSRNCDLYLSAGNNNTSANRTVIDLSPENTKLKITYIKIK